MGVNKDNQFIVTINKDGQMTTTYHSAEDYNTKVMPDLLANYTPEQYSVAGLNTVTPEAVKADGQYIVSVYANGAEHRKPFTGAELLDGRLNRFAQKYPEYTIQSVEGAVSTKQENPEEIYAIPWERKQKAAMDKVIGNVRKTYDNLNDFLEQDWMQSYYKQDALQNLADRAVYYGATKSDEELAQMQQERKDMSDLRRITKNLEDINNQLSEWTMREAEIEEFGGENTDWLIANAGRKKELEAKKAELIRQQTANPFYNKEAKRLMGISEQIISESANHRGEPMRFVAGRLNPTPTTDKDVSYYNSARRLAKQTQTTLNAPNDNENGFVAFAKGHIDTFKTEDFWTAGLSTMADSFQVKGVFEEIADKVNSDYSNESIASKMDEGYFDDALTDGQKALLLSFASASEAQALRAGNTSSMYNAGAISANSLMFMAQFILTGGVGNAFASSTKAGTKAAAKGLASWLAKKMGKKGLSLAAGAMKAAETAPDALKLVGKGATALADAVVTPLLKTMPMTLMQTGLYKDYAQKLVERDENGNLKYDYGSAVLPAIRDAGLEVYSEMGLDPLLNVAGKVLNKSLSGLKGMARVNAFLSTKLDDMGKLFSNSEALELIRNAGINNYFTEMGEELFASAISSMWEPEALSEFFDADNLASMAVAFAPMALIGSGMSMANYVRAEQDFEALRPDMEGLIADKTGMGEADIRALFDRQSNTLQDIADKISAVIKPVTESGVINTEEWKTIYKFADAFGQKEIAQNLIDRYKSSQRLLIRTEMQQRMGDERYIGKDKDGNATISTYIDEDGKTRFVKISGEPGGLCLSVNEQGGGVKVVDTSALDIKTMKADDYFDMIISQRKGAAERQRILGETENQRKTVIQQLNERKAVRLINNATNLREDYIFLGFDGENVIVANAATGDEEQRSIQEVANALQISPSILTDAQKEQALIDRMRKNKSLARLANDFKGHPFADGLLVRMESVGDSDGESRLIATVLRNGSQVKMDVNEDQINEFVAERRQAFADNEDTAISDQVRNDMVAARDADAQSKYETTLARYTNPDGSVREGEMLDMSPETYAQYSEQKYGKDDTDNTLANAYNMAQQNVESATQALNAEANPDRKPALRTALELAVAKLDALDKVIAERNMDESSNGMLSPTEARSKYMEYEALGLNEDEIYQLCLNEIDDIQNAIAAIPVPSIGKNVNTYIAEKENYNRLVAEQRKRIDYWQSILNAPMTEAEKADAELANKRMQRRIAEISKEMSKTKDTQLLKALDDEMKVVGESFIGEAIRDIRGETPLVVTTLSSVYDDMVANGSSAEVISTVMDSITKGYSIKGYYDNSSGKIFFITENNLDVADVRDTYVHEDRHRKTRQNNTVATLLDRLQLSGLSEQEQKDYLLGELRKLTDTNFYDEMDVKTIADELISYTTEKVFNDTLDEFGIDDKISNFVKNIYNGTEEESISPSGEFDNGNGTFRVADQRDERTEVAGAAEVAEQRPGSAERGGEEISKALSDKGLVMEGGVIMSAPLAELKRMTGYLTPNEMSDEESAVRFSVETMSPWAKNYRKYPDSEERVILALENLAERMTMNELVNGVISHGKYKYGENDGGSFAGPLRTNVEYIVTFDMDTSCPRTFQYLNYVRKIERRIGRPLTQTECVQLTEMMRVYGLHLSCVYCYAENKRQALKQYYTDYINARTKVINAKTDEEALQYMYGKSTNAEEARSNDPSIALNAAAYKVFMMWRSGNETFNPSMKMLYRQFSHDRNVVLTMLDMLKDEGEIWTDLKDETIAASVTVRLGINDKRAIKVVQEIVSEWKWDAIEGREHTDYELVDEDDLMVDQRTFALWRDMTSYAKSASSAKLVSRYIPYTDELKKLSDVQKAYINGMGGVRMHSTNDFRIDYVFDYFQFMADMAALKMFGHTYTKSPEFVRIFGNSGYKINMSIAAYEDENGNIRPNADEGFAWEEAKELRSMFPNAGVMLMATSDNQIQMALDSDWIDMFIPFHHSGLPKAIWYNMRMWTDYTSKQNEKFYNATEMKAALQRDGVEIPKKAKAEDISKLFNEHFGIIMVYDSKGKRIKPHFLPGPTVVDGVEIPGHYNDPELYKELCRKYGVLPRFYGVKVKDKDGNTIDITEHPNYIKCIKETARTDTPQRPIQFNFDQPSEALGGMTPFDYAITELETRAMVETEKAKKPVKDIYKSVEEDPYGIIPDFINTVIKHKEETGEDYPIDYLTPETRRWFNEEGRVYDSRYKDVSTIPYHRNEAEIEGMSVNMRIAEEQAEIQKALDFVNGITPMNGEKMTPTSDQERDILSEGSVVRFSVRTKPNPKQTVPVYKLMRLMDGKLYPLYIDSNAMPIDLGVWYDADVPNLSALETLSAGDERLLTDSKGQTFRMGKVYLLDADGNVLEERDCKRSYTYTKSNGKKANGTISQLPSTEDINTLPAGQRWVTVTIDASGERAYHNVGINGSGSSGTFAMRPGWHASNLPSMWQIGKGSTKDLRDDNFVWVRGEMAAEKEFKYGVDEGMTKSGDMPTRMPVDGFYSFATNPKSQKDKKAKKEAEARGEEYKGQDWYISGAFRPLEIISDAEARNVIDEHNKANNTKVPYDYARESGKVFNAQTMQLEDNQDVVKDGGVRFQVSERGQRLFDAAKEEYGTTKDFREAGYLLPDGSMLDFSDGEPGTRTIDHRNIAGVINDKNYETRTEYMDDFIGEGAIRLIPETAAVSLAQKPSDEQKSVLRSYIYRYNGEVEVEIYYNGNSVADAFYRAKTSPSRVLKDIDEYFEKGVAPIGNDVSFRVENNNQRVFISNALASLDKIQMKQGNAQAWINKIQQAGGLKKEEDKWIGLTDWLKEQDGNISKEDVAEYIREHQVRIEEMRYSEEVTPESISEKQVRDSITDGKSIEELQEELEEHKESASRYDEIGEYPTDEEMDKWLTDVMMQEYGDDFDVAFDIIDGEIRYSDNISSEEDELYGQEDESGERFIHSTRLRYTTEGLRNNREIALVAPAIQPYNETDQIHFGDAENGRAVAWARFGDAKDADGNKVLVIDEIQSKRHQEGKEKGYKGDKEYQDAKDRYDQAIADVDAYWKELTDRYGLEVNTNMTPEEKSLLDNKTRVGREAFLELEEKTQKQKESVPDAPFRDSWDALAMKRMLRLAAEEGYDKIAWTNGQMQSDRYGLEKRLSAIGYSYDGENYTIQPVDLNGNEVFIDDYSEKDLAGVIGKEMAAKIIEQAKTEPMGTIEGDNLKLQNSGMRYFYDQKLVNWMNKYGKKWGVEVEDLTLNRLENKDGWHSIDITPEMKESVMQGQVMFRAIEITPEVRDEMERIAAVARVRGEYLKAPNGADTNLNPEQWAMVRTKKFKDWFGLWENDPENASKVVDENGEPMVVYHGTNKQVTEFNIDADKVNNTVGDPDGFYFTNDWGQAGNYSRASVKKTGEGKFNVQAAFLNLRNPVDATDAWKKNKKKPTDKRKTYGEVKKSVYSTFQEGVNDGYMITSNNNAWEFVAVSPNQIKSATDNNGEFSRENDDIRFSVIGENAALIDKSQEGIIRMENLEIARKMENDLKPDWGARDDDNAIKIKAATGWERGADGKWRYEVEDVVTLPYNYWLMSKKKLTLGDIVEDGTVMRLYPDLKDINIVKMTSKTDIGGAYIYKTNTIELPFGALKNELVRYNQIRPKTISEFEKTVLHEIQHAIQRREGFAKGGNPTMLTPEGLEKYDKLLTEYKIIVDEFNSIDYEQRNASNPIARKLYDKASLLRRQMSNVRKMYSLGMFKYKKIAGEVESRNVENRKRMTDEERRNTLLASTEDVDRKDQLFIMDSITDMEKVIEALGNADRNIDDSMFSVAEIEYPLGKDVAFKVTSGSYFSGAGLLEAGLKGIIDSKFAVEFDNDIAAVYRDNYGQHIINADVQAPEVLEEILRRVTDTGLDYFHASPVCHNYSKAKYNAQETELDISTAKATARLIREVSPEVVTIENAPSYKNGEAVNEIRNALNEMGYNFDEGVYNSADFGSPMSRSRFILRAVKNGNLPIIEQKTERKGWYEAVADLIPSLEKGDLADWQKQRLDIKGVDYHNPEEPLIVYAGSPSANTIIYEYGSNPAPSINANEGGSRIVMPNGDIYLCTPEIFKRLMGLPDSFVLPNAKTLSYKVLGNGIPVELTDGVIAPLLKDVDSGSTNDGARFKIGPVAQMKRDGVQSVMSAEEMNDFANSVISAGLDIDEVKAITEIAIANGGNYTDAVFGYLADRAKEDVFTTEEENAIETARKLLVKQLGIEDEKLTQNELLWISYDYVHRNDDNINQQIANQRLKRNLGQAKSVQTKMSLQDYLDAAAEARDDIKAEYNALMALADSLNTIMEGMHARRAYDRLTVGRIVKLADQVLTSKLLDNATNGDIKQILGKVREATGMRNVQAVVKKLLNIIIDNNLRRLDGLLAKEMKRKAVKVDKNNVVNQGALDISGQKIMDAVNKHLTLDSNNHIVVVNPEGIPDEIDKAMEDIYSNDEAVSKDAELRLMGLSIARQYVDKVYTTIKEETEINESLDEMKKKKEAGEIDSKTLRQFEKEQTRALTDCRMERVGALTELIQRMQDMSAASHSLAMQFLQSNVERIRQIQHDANADMQGIPADEHSEKDTLGQKILNFSSNYTLNPLATFDMMLRALGRHSANGEGYLWNRFMRGWIDATSREYEGIKESKAMLDAKVREVFGRKKMEWSDLYAMVNRMPKATVSFLNGGEMKEYEITQGNLLYIMLADQMVDGRMKLRAMGITEEQVEAIRKHMDPRFISLADWIVNEFLPSRRENYNAVHERMFGAPMSKVDNYFPLRILANARAQKIDVGNPNSQKETPSTVTGSIMKRTRNALALDILNTDAFVLVMDHVNKMEHWAAFAEWNRDISDLLSYKRFNNQLQNMEAVYGTKENLVKKFRDIANIAAGSYVPNESPYDINAGKIAKFVTVAKISFIGYTAIKQLQSALAYFSEVNPKYFVEGLAKGWEWSMNNLPIFEKRVKARNMGDQVISQETLPLILEKISSLGMAPNVLIDAYTVSTGAYAIYKTKYDKYIKMGFAPAAADKRAKQDAVILYNETQQSSENAFMSPVQMDRTMTAKGVSVFRNSSFGYGRQVVDAIRNLARRFKKGYEREAIEFMTKQFIREGLEPNKAFDAAKSIYNRQGIKDVVRIILFGFIIPSTWTMLAGLPYLIFGDDDDKKEEMMKEYLLRGLFGPLEGLAAGTVLSEAGYQLAFGGELENINPVQMPITQDFIRLAESFGNDKVKTIHDIVGLGMQMGLGVNPQTFEDVVIAVIDACNGDLGTAREALLLGLRIISAPQSSIDELYIDEIQMSNLEAKNLTIPELAQRYAEYKKMRGAGAFTPLYERYPDLENKVMERYINRFNLKAKERLGTTDLADRYDDLAEEAKAMEERVSRLRRRAKAGDEEADQQLMDIFLGNEYGTLKRFTDQQSKVNSAIMDAVKSQSLEEMREYLNLAEELKAEIVSEIDGGADSGVRNRNEFITFTKGLLPEMSKLDEQYLDEFNDNHPEFEEDKDESTKAAKAKIESNTKRIKEIDEELKKYQKELPNGKVHTFNQPARSKLNAEKRKLQSDNKEQRAILKESKSRQLEYKDYIPEDILNSPSFQVYMEMKPLGSMSGNTFKFKELRSLEKQLKNATDEDEREELQMKINAKKEELSKKMQRILNE